MPLYAAETSRNERRTHAVSLQHAHCDLIVVGAGPSALAHVIRARSAGISVLVVARDIGGTMGLMGAMRLQSYIPELTINGAPVELDDFVADRRQLRPTGAEYAQYIQTCFEMIGATVLLGTVRFLQKQDGIFRLALSDGAVNEYGDNVSTVTSERVLLATGVRPNVTAMPSVGIDAMDCFEAYGRMSSGRFGAFQGRDVCIIGSGNSAFQLAAALARVARRVIILARRYVGMYPLETGHPFALRAPSFQTLELAYRSTLPTALGPLNSSFRALAPVFIHVFRTIAVDSRTGDLVATLEEASTDVPLIGASLDAACREGLVRRKASCAPEWRLSTQGLVVISATGVTANIPPNSWPELIDKDSGFIAHADGATSVSGLFVAGCAAGYRSVNQMQSVDDLPGGSGWDRRIYHED